jgi:hypothetical protein
MNVEQRLVRAFRDVDRVEPSPDLWSRVVHSIEEDRRHRRRVVISAASLAAAVLVLVAVGVAALRDGPGGRYVHGPTLELLELVALTFTATLLGPAIRRFGRGYVSDLWPGDETLPTALLRLLDLAYGLVLAGFVLLTTQLEPPRAAATAGLADQLAEAAARLGGLLLVVGLLHAVTLVLLPVVALVERSTRAGRKLPRWLVIAFVVVAVWEGVQLVGAAIALLVAGAS